jgi:polyphosphate kinase 2 (PPK2 family)
MAKKAKDSDVPTGKLSRNYYEKEMTRLQGELVQMQLWVKEAKAKVAVLFEGRDAAGKGGVIKRITERTSPRVFRVVALPAPSEREQTQVFAQRYIERFPAGGEVCLFDRSWYNRAGVDRVMGFATERSTSGFCSLCRRWRRHSSLAGSRS